MDSVGNTAAKVAQNVMSQAAKAGATGAAKVAARTIFKHPERLGFFGTIASTRIFMYVTKKLDWIMPRIIAYVVFIWALIGFYYLFKYIWHVLYGIYSKLLRPCKNLKKVYGPWALVTGATDGIGEAMAEELARRGMKLVLLSRDMKKLEATRQAILEKYSTTEVQIYSVDFSDFNAEVRAGVAEFLKDLDIGVLVNNVGYSYPFTKYFHELSDANVDNLISINIDSTTWMTKIVVDGMVKRKRGAIVNVASAAGVSVSPLLSQYSAAKGYVTMFSKALNVELWDHHVHVQCQIPLYVATKLAKIRNSSLMVPTPRAYAYAAVACIGYEAVVSPYWTHAIQLYLMTFIPEWWMEAWLIKLMHYGIRRAGLAKENREKDKSKEQ
jgi:17beta-estradiol 17-dehydrogenase / very-long-chain 3-oxoacyl-CoA reductase